MTETRRRRAGRGGLLPLAVFALVLGAVLYLSAGCASSTPQARTLPPGPPLGTTARLLEACEGGDPSYCFGALVTLIDVEFEAGKVCEPPADLSQIVAVAVAALRANPAQPGKNDEPQDTVSQAFASAWPCPAEPARFMAAGAWR